jgi:hypothetical protein
LGLSVPGTRTDELMFGLDERGLILGVLVWLGFAVYGALFWWLRTPDEARGSGPKYSLEVERIAPYLCISGLIGFLVFAVGLFRNRF